MSLEPRHHVPPNLLEYARQMRHNPAPAEQKLWHCLRNRRLNGFKFRRQQPLTPFIADFFCAQCKLVVEVDGDTHDTAEAYDALRTRRLNRNGLHVIRFTNSDVHDHLDAVAEEILAECERLYPHSFLSAHSGSNRPPSPLAGEGGGEG